MQAEAGSQSAIERRIEAVASVRRVLDTVWALARAQLPLAQSAAAEASTYLDGVDAMIDRLSGAPRPAEGEATLWIVFGPERPYSGPLARKTAEQIPRRGALGIVGERLAETVASDPALARRVRFALHGAASHDEPEVLAAEVARETLLHAQRRHVVLLAPQDGGHHLRASVLLAGAREPVPNPPETYAPARAVLAAALREATTGRIAVAMAEALHAEVRARLVAADQARRAAERKLEALTRNLRAARQQEITAELLEVVAGREASQAQAASARGRRPPRDAAPSHTSSVTVFGSEPKRA